MALRAGPEGKLSRVHVDAAEGSDITVVIGFYDQIASTNAINVQETVETARAYATRYDWEFTVGAGAGLPQAATNKMNINDKMGTIFFIFFLFFYIVMDSGSHNLP